MAHLGDTGRALLKPNWEQHSLMFALRITLMIATTLAVTAGCSGIYTRRRRVTEIYFAAKFFD